MMIFFLLLLAVFNVTMFHWLGDLPSYLQLNSYTWESDEFRGMRLGEAVAKQDSIDSRLLAALMTEHGFDLTGITAEEALEKEIGHLSNPVSLSNPAAAKYTRSAALKKLTNAYDMIFRDLEYFPIPKSSRPETPDVSYENGWQDKRTYGGDRGHEGCDIMGNGRERGFYPVVSISDGVVEKMGWLEQGGWRIGIRTESGVYLYYAHLYQYADGLAEGMQVRAGDLLGYMGDSGYGKQENTVGNFDVHLHLGIYIKTDHYEELSVNPYWILRYLEKHRLTFYY